MKSSVEMLKVFCQFLHGEGNFVRHLKKMGYVVFHEQSFVGKVKRGNMISWVWASEGTDLALCELLLVFILKTMLSVGRGALGAGSTLRFCFVPPF